jgi:hypothetical protein
LRSHDFTSKGGAPGPRVAGEAIRAASVRG